MARTAIERLLALLALLGIAVAWFAGARRAQDDLEPLLRTAFPEAVRFESVGPDRFSAHARDERLLGYLGTGRGAGYNGPLRVVVGLDPAGQVIAVAVLEHRETPSYYRRVTAAGWPEVLGGRSAADPLDIGADLDAVSGATRTADALADAARAAARELAARHLELALPPAPPEPMRFGLREIALILLFAMGLLALRGGARHHKILRWATLLLGLLLLGFVSNAPLTIGAVAKLLMGYWPSWQRDLYWILLLGGVLLLLLARNKNPYCDAFCPFGAAQECLGAIGGARARPPSAVHTALRWLQRLLAWGAIVVALLYRDPALGSYEVFAALFDLTGETWQFALLAAIIATALFVRRPWCRYLCPVAPVIDYLRLMRRWAIERWSKLRDDARAT